MTLPTHAGGCHCGALRFDFDSSLALADIAPRACDCDYCRRHAACWVSDGRGLLRLRADPAKLRRYRQGSGQADFLLCGGCGVLVAVAIDAEGRLFAAANRNAFDARDAFAEAIAVSPQRLAPSDKRTRWLQLWTPMQLALH